MRLLLKKADLFSTSQFLRYKSDADYNTVSGGVCSLLIIIVFCVLFLNAGIKTVNKEIIEWDA